MQLPKFSEGDDIEVFLKSFEKLAESYKWEKSEWAIRLVPQLTGKALEAYSRMSASDSSDFRKVKKAILERYGLNALAYRDKFRHSKQDRTETFKEYAIRVEGYLKHWVTAENVSENYHKLYDLFMREQLIFTASPDLQVWLRERNPHTYMQLVEMADTYQLAHKQTNTNSQYQKDSNLSTIQGTKRSNQSDGYQKLPSKNIRKCFFCESPEYLISNCPAKKAKDGKSNIAGTRPVYDGNSATHTNALLLSPKKIVTNTCKVRLPLSVEIKDGEVKELENGLKLVKGYVNGKEACILRDTGCTTVCISQKFANQEERWVSLANGAECLCYEVEVILDSPYISGTVTTLTMDCPFADVILGDSAFVKKETVSYSNENGSRIGSETCYDKDKSSYGSDNRITENSKSERDETVTKDTISSVETRNMKIVRENEEKRNEKIEAEYLQERNDRLNKKNFGKGELTEHNINKENSMDLRLEQQSDSTLYRVRELADVNEEDKEETYFFYRKGILYRQFQMRNEEVLEQIVVPEKHREHVMHIAHDGPLEGHLGNKKTREKNLNHFYWPGIFPNVAKFCRSCKNCQKCVPKGRISSGPLIPIQPMEEPFKRVAMDIVGPLNKSGRGHKFILVLIAYLFTV